MNKILSAAVCIYLATMLNACTSSKSDEGNPEQAPVESSLDNPDGGAPVAADGKAKSADEAQAGFLDDQLPDDSLDKKAGAAPAANGAPAATTAGNAPPPADGAPLSLDDTTPPPATDNSMSAAGIDTPPPADKPEKESKPGKASKKMADADAGMKSDEPPKPKAALQKIKDAPYHEGGQLLNSVYIARPGDDYKKVSTMIYGSDAKVADLKAGNPGMKKLKPGQKVYYSSPKRPQDESKMMTYYEDAGIPPETYVAKDGDDLKKISKDLVGYSDGWKEVWATNAVESKGKIPAGTELKYWKGAASAGADGAQASAATPPPAGNLPPPPDANMPPPPPAQAGMGTPPPPPDANMPPPPPPVPDQAKAGGELPPPPPPPPDNMNPPPPPGGAAAAPGANAATAGKPGDKKPKPPGAPAPEEGLDQETMMYLGVAGIVALGLAGIIIIRKRKANQAGAGYEAQVG